MHEMAKNLRKTIIQKIAKRMLPMAKRLLKLWFEHTDEEMTGEQWDHQVQRLYPFDRMFGAVSLKGRTGVQARFEDVAGVRTEKESLRLLFGVGASALKKWFRISGTGPDMVVEVIAPVITAVVALHHSHVLSGYTRSSVAHRALSTSGEISVTGRRAQTTTCGH